MLDFSQLSKPRYAVVPVLEKAFQYLKKQYSIEAEDGWYKVKITNNRAEVVEPATIQDRREIPQEMDFALGYTHNNTIVFQNFDVAKRKWNHGLTAPLYFNQSPSFESVKAVVWEDRRVYWGEPNYADLSTYDLKEILESEQDIRDKKGITPELRSVFLFHALEREQTRRLLEESARKEADERMLRDVPYRLKVTFERAGAEYVRHQLTGNRIVVDWKIPGSDYEFNSVVDSRTWQVVEAGYCMSGDDRRHNLTSLVKTAEDYEERGLIHITRR